MQATLTPAADWLLIVPVVLPLVGAALLLMLRGRVIDPALGAAGIVACVGAADLAVLLRVIGQGPLAMTMGHWLPPFGISFVADAMGAGFVLLACVVTLATLAFGHADAPSATARGGAATLVLLLLAGVDGAFLTGDLFNLYVWFELILIASLGLLALSGTPAALGGAVKYGVLNLVGTALFLLALGLLYGALGTLNMADILGRAAHADSAVMTGIASLLLVAFATKAAALPVNAWLPASYHTPSAATSALLGGVLTKVGVYALLRTLLLVLPASRDLLHPALAAVAGATLLLAPLGALAETNLRRAVGYLLIGGVGAAIIGLALPTATGVAGAIAYVAHAMLTIAALYLVAGLVEAATGETDTRRMGGLYAASAPLSILFLLLVLAVAGVPPFLGFWPKLLLLQGAVERWSLTHAAGTADWAAPALAACLVLNALLTLVVGARLWSQIFWRAAADGTPEGSTSAGRMTSLQWGSAAVLTLLVVLAGLWPEPLLRVARTAASGLLDPHAYVAAVGLGATP